MSRRLVDLDLHVQHETAAAILVAPDDDPATKGVWLPKSAIEFEWKDRRKAIASVTLPESLATQKGLV